MKYTNDSSKVDQNNPMNVDVRVLLKNFQEQVINLQTDNYIKADQINNLQKQNEDLKKQLGSLVKQGNSSKK